MKRTIIYVFGPKRLAHQYRESINVQNSQDSCDVTNWLKIGMTTSEDDNLLSKSPGLALAKSALSWMFSNIHI